MIWPTEGLEPVCMLPTLLFILELPPQEAYLLSSGDSLPRGVDNVFNIAPLVQYWNFFRAIFLEGWPPLLSKYMYLAPISAGLALVGGDSVGRHPLVSHFMQGSRQLRPFCPTRVSSWDLSIILVGLSGSSFWAIGICLWKCIDSQKFSLGGFILPQESRVFSGSIHQPFMYVFCPKVGKSFIVTKAWLFIRSLKIAFSKWVWRLSRWRGIR